MRVLILGGAGMLGHRLWQGLRHRFDVFVTVRRVCSYYSRFDLFDPQRLMGEIDVRRAEDLLMALSWSQPDVVINTVGVIKQRKESNDPLLNLEINSLFPHRLALACRARSARLIHISTDCVFSGKQGHYTEDSASDASDLYGRTKYLGEILGERVLTLRTSLIGREIETRFGLLEWFLTRRNKRCRGFSQAIFSGLTALTFADIVADVMQKHPDLNGLYHVSGNPISKYNLLKLINEVYDLGVAIENDPEFVCDRSLDSTRFQQATGCRPLEWRLMILQMKEDTVPYDAWKGIRNYSD
jgi:dTDP-4-dehydrorhamnose reductase